MLKKTSKGKTAKPVDKIEAKFPDMPMMPGKMPLFTKGKGKAKAMPKKKNAR